MIPTTRCLPALALCWLCATTFAQDKDKPAPAPAPIKVGVVDLQKVMDHYPAAIQDQKRLREMGDQFDAQLKERTKAIDELRAQLSNYKPDSTDVKLMELKLRINLLEQERAGLAKLLGEQYDRELQKWELSFYEDMTFAVQAVAKERGMDLVLRADDWAPDDKDPTAAQQRHALLRRRTVWFAGEQIDLTPHLIKYLQVIDVRAERQKVAEAAAKKNGTEKSEVGKNEAGKTDGGSTQGK